ncbi:MAG: alcohol dehydrogenase catalytic domain-containing protein [Pseudomonadota bacterium]|nr:MAG: alcohol dehydrogenase catalytic domain-containing protein [Pseudomonadota bacterium]
MRAMVLRSTMAMRTDARPLEATDWPDPEPDAGEVLIRVHVCAVCHTELDEIEGRVAACLPIIPGHEAVGRIVSVGPGVDETLVGGRVGVGWIHSACGECEWCRRGEENLCPDFRGTGCHAHGGYAEYMAVPAAFTHPIPDVLDDVSAAPMLCGGAIGLRSLRLSGLENGQVLGLTGYGGSNHQVHRLASLVLPDSPVVVWARNPEQRRQALDAGAQWAGKTHDHCPLDVRAIIDTTPVWETVLAALGQLAPGGRLVINAIAKETGDRRLLADLDYPRQLWMERSIQSVANVARQDIRDFLALAGEHAILRPVTTRFPLERANEALHELTSGQVRGAKVLEISGQAARKRIRAA